MTLYIIFLSALAATFVLFLIHLIGKIIIDLSDSNDNILTKAFKVSWAILLFIVLLITIHFLTHRKVKPIERTYSTKQYVQMYDRNTNWRNSNREGTYA